MSEFSFEELYAFTLTSTINQRLVGDVPGGTRLDLTYLDGGTSTIEVNKEGGLFPQGTKGTIITGQDWVLVGEDGVADFDGRFTARIDGILIGGHLQGRADLKTLVMGGKQIDAKANSYETWYGGVGPDAKMPLVLPIVFEIPNPNEDSAEAQGTAIGDGIDDETGGDATESAQESPTVADGLARLRRCLAVGRGQVTFKPNQRHSPIKVITLEIVCVIPGGGET